MNESITILIVDDHQMVRQGVRAFLETQPDLEVLGEAENGEEAVRFTTQHVPDVVLMDLVMPGGMDGVEATRLVKTASPRTQVVVLTSYHEDEHIFPAIRAGALSYILKDIDSKELGEVVRKAAQGEAVLHSRVAARVIQEVQGARVPFLGQEPSLIWLELLVSRLLLWPYSPPTSRILRQHT